MASKEKGAVQYPSSSFVKYLSIASAVVGLASVILDAALPMAQQLGKKKSARAGLEPAIRLSVVLTLVKLLPRLIGAVRTLRAQLSTEVTA